MERKFDSNNSKDVKKWLRDELNCSWWEVNQELGDFFTIFITPTIILLILLIIWLFKV